MDSISKLVIKLTIPPELDALLKRIDNNKKSISERRPLKTEEVKQLHDYYRVGFTYSSNALEGNTLTLIETKIIIEDGLTINGKSIRECNEALGGAKAYDLMLKTAQAEPLRIDENTILELHRLFYSGIDLYHAGKYRNVRVFITGTDYVPPEPERVPALMNSFISELDQRKRYMHPVDMAAYAHRRLVQIHPFIDGNGRTARLLMNLILINHGYSVVSIPPILRGEYINSLIAAHREESPTDFPFRKLIFQCEIEEQKSVARMLGIPLQKERGLGR